MPKQTPSQTEQAPASPPRPDLAQLLRRQDVWRGHSQAFTDQASWSTGYPMLDQALLHQGWPLSNLVEVCQTQACQSEWLLLGPTVRHACAQGGYTLLLNPPTQPYGPGLIQQGVDLNRVILVQANSTPDFVASFVEISRSPACKLLLSWEPQRGLSYAELRKCQLAAAEHAGLCVLLRQQRQQQQSSPASLRISARLQAQHLELNLFKQRGKLHNEPVYLPLPHNWYALPVHGRLGQPVQTQRNAKVFVFTRHKTSEQLEQRG